MEKQFKGAVFFDYDGTLTDKDAGLFVPSPKTVEAINRLRKNGYAAMSKPRGLMRCSRVPVTAHVRAIFPVFWGISGSNSTILSTLSPPPGYYLVSAGYCTPKQQGFQP